VAGDTDNSSTTPSVNSGITGSLDGDDGVVLEQEKQEQLF